MRKMIAVFVLAVGMVLFMAGCDEVDGDVAETSAGYYVYNYTAVALGNTAGNINNRGLVAMCEDMIYFQNPQSVWRIYSMNHDGSDMVRLNEYASTFINVIDGVIYYLGFPGGGVPGSIYRMNTDGSGHQLIFEGTSTLNITGLKVVGNQIFHTVVDSSDERVEGSGLFVMQTDGSERRRVTPRDTEVRNINVVGDYVFFRDGLYMFRVNVDGTNEQPLNLRGISMVVYGDRIYFMKFPETWSSSGLIYSANLDGGNLQQLSREFANMMNVANGQVLFRASSGSNGLYKTNLDGRDELILPSYAWGTAPDGTEFKSWHSHRISDIFILGDELFIYLREWEIGSHDSYLSMFRMNLDGSNKRRVE